MSNCGSDLKRVDAMTDEEVERRALEDPDAQPTEQKDWIGVPLVPSFQHRGQLINVPLSPRIVGWFKDNCDSPFERINEVLEDYIEQQTRKNEKHGARRI